MSGKILLEATKRDSIMLVKIKKGVVFSGPACRSLCSCVVEEFEEPGGDLAASALGLSMLALLLSHRAERACQTQSSGDGGGGQRALHLSNLRSSRIPGSRLLLSNDFILHQSSKEWAL